MAIAREARQRLPFHQAIRKVMKKVSKGLGREFHSLFSSKIGRDGTLMQPPGPIKPGTSEPAHSVRIYHTSTLPNRVRRGNRIKINP